MRSLLGFLDVLRSEDLLKCEVPFPRVSMNPIIKYLGFG